MDRNWLDELRVDYFAKALPRGGVKKFSDELFEKIRSTPELETMLNLYVASLPDDDAPMTDEGFLAYLQSPEAAQAAEAQSGQSQTNPVPASPARQTGSGPAPMNSSAGVNPTGGRPAQERFGMAQLRDVVAGHPTLHRAYSEWISNGGPSVSEFADYLREERPELVEDAVAAGLTSAESQVETVPMASPGLREPLRPTQPVGSNLTGGSRPAREGLDEVLPVDDYDQATDYLRQLQEEQAGQGPPASQQAQAAPPAARQAQAAQGRKPQNAISRAIQTNPGLRRWYDAYVEQGIGAPNDGRAFLNWARQHNPEGANDLERYMGRTPPPSLPQPQAPAARQAPPPVRGAELPPGDPRVPPLPQRQAPPPLTPEQVDQSVAAMAQGGPAGRQGPPPSPQGQPRQGPPPLPQQNSAQAQQEQPGFWQRALDSLSGLGRALGPAEFAPRPPVPEVSPEQYALAAARDLDRQSDFIGTDRRGPNDHERDLFASENRMPATWGATEQGNRLVRTMNQMPEFVVDRYRQETGFRDEPEEQFYGNLSRWVAPHAREFLEQNPREVGNRGPGRDAAFARWMEGRLGGRPQEAPHGGYDDLEALLAAPAEPDPGKKPWQVVNQAEPAPAVDLDPAPAPAGPDPQADPAGRIMDRPTARRTVAELDRTPPRSFPGESQAAGSAGPEVQPPAPPPGHGGADRSTSDRNKEVIRQNREFLSQFPAIADPRRSQPKPPEQTTPADPGRGLDAEGARRLDADFDVPLGDEAEGLKGADQELLVDDLDDLAMGGGQGFGKSLFRQLRDQNKMIYDLKAALTTIQQAVSPRS